MKVEVDLNEDEAFSLINYFQNQDSINALNKLSKAIAKVFGFRYSNGRWIHPKNDQRAG